jgi:hypothetical protein
VNPPVPFRVAVISPYYRETPVILRDCLDSVLTQTHPCTHFLVADGHPQDLSARKSVEHFILPRSHRDAGNTARAVGSLSAMNQGFDAVAYLDADNWYYPDHVESMVALHRATAAAVCTATRTINRLDGSLMYTDLLESNGREHVDTSCLFITRPAFRVLPVWGMMPPQLGPLCDRVMWGAIRGHRFTTAHNPQPTVAFRTQYEAHYRAIGEPPPPGAKSNADSTGVAYRWWQSLSAEDRAAWSRHMGIPP